MRRTKLTTLLALAVLVALAGAAGPLRADEESAPKAPSKAEIERLIAQLGANDFATREKASRDLLQIGEPAREALERTMKQSDNMEARWRAEQILRRLDREGERPMGPGGRAAPQPVPPSAPPGAPGGIQPPEEDLGGLTPGRGWGEMERRLEELMRRGLGAPMPFADRNAVLEAPGLRLQVTALRLFAAVELHVEDYPGLFLGRSLEDVLDRHPELEKHESMPQLKEKWDAYKKENPQLFPFEILPFGSRQSGGLSISIGGSGIEFTQTPEGVKVRIRDRDADGNVTEREYEGESLDEIRRQHPEIADRLKGFSTITIGPQIFRGRGLGPRLPVPPVEDPPVVTPSEPDLQRAPFGVQVAPVEPVLAVQLGLEAGHGILVVDVIKGSLAERMGVLRYDVIVAIDGTPVTDYPKGVEALRAGGTSNAIESIEVIRRGKRVPLAR